MDRNGITRFLHTPYRVFPVFLTMLLGFHRFSGELLFHYLLVKLLKSFNASDGKFYESKLRFPRDKF